MQKDLTMLMERRHHIDELEQVFATSRAGQGQIVLLSGEAGIGKSSLVSAFKEAVFANHDDIVWAVGGCEALFTPRILGPVCDMASCLGSDVETLLLADAPRAELYSAVLATLDSGPPVVMVCEDLHWADDATLDLLKYLARRLRTLPVLLIITYRDNEVDSGHSITQLLGDLPAPLVHRIALDPLSSDAVKALASHYKVSLVDNKVYEITNGNPFYVTEVLASQAVADSVPASVRDAVAARIGQLESEARDFLELISVIPNTMSYAFLEALVGDALDKLVDECITKGLLIEREFTVKFRHELTRLATLEWLTPAKRRHCHSRCLDVLLQGELTGQFDQLVHHASGAFRGATVLEYAPRAANAAALAGGHRQAASHYASALRFVDDAEPEFAASLYENWAYEALLYNRTDNEVIDARRHAITLWRALGRTEKVGENLRHLSRLHWYRGESDDAQHYADQAIRVLESLPQSAERAMAFSLRSQLHMLNDQMDAAIACGRLALKECDVGENIDVRAHALNNIGTAMAFRGQREGVELLNESLALSLANDIHEHAARAYNNLAEYAVEFWEFALAEETLLNGIAYDSENDLDAWTYYLSGRLAQLRLEQGRIDDAVQIATGVLSMDRLSLLTKLPATIVLARALMRRGDPAADETIAAALEQALATDELQNIVPARLTIIEDAWLKGTPELGYQHLEILAHLNAEDRHPWNIGALHVWAKRFSMKTDKFALVDLPAPYSLELAGDYQGAAQAWRELGAQYNAAMVELASNSPKELVVAAEALRRMGAHTPLEVAVSSAKRQGMSVKVVGRSRGSSQVAKSHPLGLTAKEQIVLRHLVSDKSNQEIAEELNRSTRTVEHHVSSILAKLNASNRIAAVLRIQNEPWLLEETR